MRIPGAAGWGGGAKEGWVEAQRSAEKERMVNSDTPGNEDVVSSRQGLGEECTSEVEGTHVQHWRFGTGPVS